MKPVWRKGIIGEYSDRGYIYGRWGLARLHTENDKISNDSWNVFKDGKVVDTYKDTLKSLKLHIEELVRTEEEI